MYIEKRKEEVTSKSIFQNLFPFFYDTSLLTSGPIKLVGMQTSWLDIHINNNKKNISRTFKNKILR
jgi:hypothetical protein